MKKSKWEAIPKQVRDMIVASFKMAGIDFERDCVVLEETEGGTDKVASSWVTRAEAATYAKCSTDTIDNWIAKGCLVRAKLGAGKPGSVLIERISLEKFLRSKIVNPKKRIRKTAPSVVGGHRVRRAK